MTGLRHAFVWITVLSVSAASIVAAAMSPLLAWREPVYVVAGFAGVFALVLLLFQPLLARGYLPAVSILQSRRMHRGVGIVLVFCIIVHVVSLWVTSPPDVIDALRFTSPTPFSIWGVIGMWCVFATACLAAFRRKCRPQIWRLWHKIFAIIIVATSVVHAMLIEGTMEILSKSLLCLLVVVATIAALVKNPTGRIDR